MCIFACQAQKTLPRSRGNFFCNSACWYASIILIVCSPIISFQKRLKTCGLKICTAHIQALSGIENFIYMCAVAYEYYLVQNTAIQCHGRQIQQNIQIMKIIGILQSSMLLDSAKWLYDEEFWKCSKPSLGPIAFESLAIKWHLCFRWCLGVHRWLCFHCCCSCCRFPLGRILVPDRCLSSFRCTVCWNLCFVHQWSSFSNLQWYLE